MRAMSDRIETVTLRQLKMPPHVPYVLSYRTFEEFEPCLIEIVTARGRTGFGDADIERAATIDRVRLCKLKLKRFGGLAALRHSLERVRALGMGPVLGDGSGSAIICWLEACVARFSIRNAGEFIGYLQSPVTLFREPLGFADGALTMPAGHRPVLDPARFDTQTTACEVFSA
jgi:L-alanine-DL-glutamate epimerase-like enolase superfamily enzyme